MNNQRKLKDPVAKYFGTPAEVKELLERHKNGEILTLEETSKVIGLSKSAIKAIEVRALRKLKEAICKKFGKNIKFNDFIDTCKGRTCATMIGAEDR